MTDNEEKDDLQFFRKHMSGVRKLSTNHNAPARPKPRPVARFARDDHKQVLQDSLSGDPGIDAHEEVSFSRSGITPSLLRKVRRGKYSIASELDLHGLNLADATVALVDFIADCQTRDHRCVRIVHGKGTRSGHAGPVLKPMVYRLLRRSDAVLAYTTARQSDGGSGALYVLLR